MITTILTATPTLDTGNTAWMMMSTILVLLMSIPGIALFYGGLVRQKNVLSIVMQTMLIVGAVSIIWVAFGYSWAFDDSYFRLTTVFRDGRMGESLPPRRDDRQCHAHWHPRTDVCHVSVHVCAHHAGAHTRCLRRAYKV